jgi:hypothetical protein
MEADHDNHQSDARPSWSAPLRRELQIKSTGNSSGIAWRIIRERYLMAFLRGRTLCRECET